MASRSHFYVDTPRSPSQRHSMFVTHSEVAQQRQDLSSNSSSATLPSTAGSVDRLTGLEEKKSSRFFTLKPKTSFSLKPFFRSTSSLVSQSPGKRRKAVVLERRDSSVQTEETRPEFGEVGVQTLNASTVDVPVQTCLRAWEGGDSYGQRRLAYATPRLSPFWSSSPPSASSSALSNSLTPKTPVKDPLASPKLIKYAAPGESEKAALLHQSALSPLDVNSCQPVSSSPSHSEASSSPSVSVKYFSAKELTGNAISLSVAPESQPVDKSQSQPSSEGIQSENSVAPEKSITERGSNKILKENNDSIPAETTVSDNHPLEVSDDSKHSVIQNLDHPLSALKIERTDSPKRSKTVHFDLSEPESSQNVNNDSSKPRNIDKDFEALLKDLNILTDNECDLTVPLITSTSPAKPPSNLISPSLKSALDALREDFLAPIPENANELNDFEPGAEPKSTSNNVNRDTKLEDTVENLASNRRADSPKQPFVRSISQYDNQNLANGDKNDPVTPTSLSVFTSADSGSNPETDSLQGNVYDNVIKEETSVKAVPLPTLPSFFEPPSHPQTADITEVLESANLKNSPPDNQTESAMPLETEFDRTRLSRSSSVSSNRSNSKLGVDSYPESMNKFDSCENLDQLEEEIIRTLYSPDEGKLEEKIMKNIDLPPSESFQNSGTTATHMRRVILDQLLSGKSVEDIVPNYPVYHRANSVPETGKKHKGGTKYTAVLTKICIDENDNTPNRTGNILDSSGNTCSRFSVPCSNAGKESNDVSDVISENANNNDSTKRSSSVFIFPEDNIPDSSISEKSPLEISATGSQSKSNSILEVRRSSWTPQTTIDSLPSKQGNKFTPVKEKSLDEKCDFTNCLRPSKIQNSPFLAKINTRSMSPCNFSPLPYHSSPINNDSTHKKSKNPAKSQEATGECDFANCLKPSQVQNSLFTAELSEITAGKSVSSLRAGSPVTTRTPSPFQARSSSLETPVTTPVLVEDKSHPEVNPVEPIKHKSELLITLQGTTKHSATKPEDLTISKAAESSNKEYSEVAEHDPKSNEPIVSNQEPKTNPAIPPPPPLPPQSNGLKSIACSKDSVNCSMEAMLQDQKSNLAAVEVSSDSKNTTQKTHVMIELEQKLQDKNDFLRRNSNDKSDDTTLSFSAKDDDSTNTERSEKILNGSSYVSNGNQNGSLGILHEKREQRSPVSNGKTDSHMYGTTKLTYSPNTVITDEPPPAGAVLLDEKVTVDGDQVHTDKYFAIPMKEVLKEKTSTTKFIPAPPKYEGIGPTEDGIPIGLRNSVKKENMHNWYKTMFKSLHKADSSNDSQEYIIGYTSEPETSKKDIMVRKKSSTLDNRTKYDANCNLNMQNYPPAAKSSIEVYNVRPRLIEDYEPGYSSVTDDNVVTSRRYLPSKNTVKPSYEFKNGYESDSYITKKKDQPEALSSEQQKMWYREIQKGGDIPQFGLGKSAPEKLKEPTIGPLPPPPLNYNTQSSYPQAVRPLTLPADYSNQNGNGYCQQMNGTYEMQMRQAIHSEMQQRISPSSHQLSPPIRTMTKSPSRTPDMKVPARALFDFKAESPKEIPLKKGDTVLVLRQLDKNWYEGEHKGIVGIFPISYVEIIPPEHVSPPPQIRTEGLGRALYDFVAQTSVELTVRKGDNITLLRRVDANWFEGIFNGKKGIVPISYVQVLQEPVDRNVKSPSQKSCSLSPSSENKEKFLKPNSVSPSVHSSSVSPLPINSERRKLPSKKGSNLVEPIMYRALYSYSPQNSDELELQEGDNVYVVEMCDDGWFVGTSVRTGIFGIFPGNYVEKAC